MIGIITSGLTKGPVPRHVSVTVNLNQPEVKYVGVVADCARDEFVSRHDVTAVAGLHTIMNVVSSIDPMSFMAYSIAGA